MYIVEMCQQSFFVPFTQCHFTETF